MTSTGDGGPLPDVAVILITYNHEAFIAESICSVLMQAYPGHIHLVVSDDHSTDRTQQIIAETVCSAPPNVTVHLNLRRENVGGLRNLSGAWEMANATGSAYLALLEGDDYWTDPAKLATQVGYLEEHPEATLSFGLATELILSDDGPPTSTVLFVPPSARPTFADLLGRNFVQTCTVAYRSGVLPEFPPWFAECTFRDWPLHLVHASVGSMHFVDRVLAVHRQHRTSVWWTPGKSQKERVRKTRAVQRLAVAHLGTPDNFRPLDLAAERQLWWARASASKPERWLHLLTAAALNPRLVKRRATMRLSERRPERPRRTSDASCSRPS